VIKVVDPGLLTTIQDIGRPGYAHLGVPPSGACDPVSLAVGNRLVGNAPGAPALEATLIGPRLRFARPTLVALAGACDTRVEECVELDVGRAVAGARIYVCVAGGIAAERVLGSCSTDLLGGLGPPPLRAGDVLRVGEPGTPGEASAAARTNVLRVVPGPRDDWFASPAQLFGTEWKVTSSSNRIGIRLDGPPLERVRTDELRSEGLVTGALQVPPNGRPIILLNDHPTTGGYPVIGVVHSKDLPSAGQLAPGDTVRFDAVR
jgi:biotin-dependent carboxylase-like uncharacterized protein